MTQGIVSIRVDGQVRFKLVTGHDGMNAPRLAQAIKNHFTRERMPTIENLQSLAQGFNFGCPECLIILVHDDDLKSRDHNRCMIVGPVDDLDAEGFNRYCDTFRVAEFNPRWKYGTADYVEVVDLYDRSSRAQTALPLESRSPDRAAQRLLPVSQH
jgi:hypothetical protein